MDWLNYHHLLYFWMVAREGGLAPAGRLLRLAHPTLSGQIKQLEERLGEKLFERSGRKLVLTETGRVVYRYADEIFNLGRELLDALEGRSSGRPMRLLVGIAEVMPKLVVRRLLEPALRMAEPLQLVCVEGRTEQLLGQLAVHELDIVLSDAPLPAGAPVRAFNHLLGESGVSFFAAPSFARLRRGFPQSLDGERMLLPLTNSPLRRALEGWFEGLGIRPRVVAELEDSALTKVLGADGLGVFTAPSAVREDVKRQYRVAEIGTPPELSERFYALSMERKLKHPAVVAIRQSAGEELFARR